MNDEITTAGRGWIELRLRDGGTELLTFSGGRSWDKVKRLAAGMTRTQTDAVRVFLGEEPWLGEGPAANRTTKQSLLQRAFVKLLQLSSYLIL